MTPDNHQTLPTNDEPLPGSKPDNITPDTPTCPAKNVQCPYYSEGGCQVAVCWVQKIPGDAGACSEVGDIP